MSQLSKGIKDLYRRATVPFCEEELQKATEHLKEQKQIDQTCDVTLNDLI